tara:strand:- start:401 stop:679 length:279 start_codon:yes stop_codon:yes gene_type:complete
MFNFNAKKIKKFCDKCNSVEKHQWVLDSKTKIADGRFEGLIWDIIFFWDPIGVIQKPSTWHFFYNDKCQTCGFESQVREMGELGPKIPPRVG